MGSPEGGLRFLQSSPGGDFKAVGGYKADNEAIRTMLREQKRDTGELHENALFREFKAQARRQRLCQGPLNSLEEPAGPPVIDDIEAEGKVRTLERIRSAGLEQEREQIGVWAAIGKPYICLGRPIEPNKSLPKLNRDELNGNAGARKQKGSRQSSRGKMQKRAQAIAPPAEVQHTHEELERDKLLKKQAVLKFSFAECLEAKFPEVPVKMSSQRKSKATSSAQGISERLQAGVDEEEPAAYGVMDPLAGGFGRALSGFDRQNSPWGPLSVDVIELGPPPEMAHITSPARPGLKDEHNPVYAWHNEFVEVGA
eukprot:evm.model.scf_402.3 EVM.evm.TU.scf_402.3   scf_402:30597-35111(+)